MTAYMVIQYLQFCGVKSTYTVVAVPVFKSTDTMLDDAPLHRSNSFHCDQHAAHVLCNCHYSNDLCALCK